MEYLKNECDSTDQILKDKDGNFCTDKENYNSIICRIWISMDRAQTEAKQRQWLIRRGHLVTNSSKFI
jgi:hypothetical protein